MSKSANAVRWVTTAYSGEDLWNAVLSLAWRTVHGVNVYCAAGRLAPQVQAVVKANLLDLRRIFEYSTQRRWRSIAASALALFNVVNRHRDRLLLGWVTVCREVKCLDMWPIT